MNNKLIGLTIGAAVAIIVLASVLVPIVNDAQTNIGPVTTRASSGASVGGPGVAYYEIGDETITYAVESSGAPLTINGEPLDTYSSVATWGALILADSGAARCRVETHALQLMTYGATESTTYASSTTATIVIDGPTNTITYTHGGEVDTLEFNEAYCLQKVDETKKGRLCAVDLTSRGGTFYVSSINDLKTWGVYTTGENDTYYAIENGKITTAVDYPASLNYTLTKVDGTTDIFRISAFSMNIGDESVVPYFCLVPAEVEGHESGGAAYSLVGVLPTIVIVAVLVGIIGTAVRGSRD